MDDNCKTNPIDSPWQPMTEPLVLRALGKVLEELGEASKAVARALIQGIDEVDPKTGKPNREAIVDEVADVIVTTGFLVNVFGLDQDHIEQRIERKIEFLLPWYKGLDDA